jgi:hypothetical protein
MDSKFVVSTVINDTVVVYANPSSFPFFSPFVVTTRLQDVCVYDTKEQAQVVLETIQRKYKKEIKKYACHLEVTEFHDLLQHTQGMNYGV